MLEAGICALERATGCSVTIIDHEHVFTHRRPRAVFEPRRSSHRKNPVCRAGFSERCIQHCRYEMNRRSLEERAPFVSCCWKGISEIVIPLTDGGVHYGMLYAGSWRAEGVVPPEGLPPEFHAARAALPLPAPARIAELTALFSVFAKGVVGTLRELHLLEQPPDARSAAILDFLRRNAAEKAGLPELAAELSLSVSRTSFLVKAHFGKTFSELLALERVARVKHFLAASEWNLRSIALRTGFHDEFHLSRVFKAHTGVSPRDWRNSGRSR